MTIKFYHYLYFLPFLQFFLVKYPFAKGEFSHSNIWKEFNDSEKFYNNSYSILKNTKVFERFSYQEFRNFTQEIENWIPPKYIMNRFPYYLAGFDFEDRPVWVSENGKYRWSDLIEQYETELPSVLEKCGLKALFHFLKSLTVKDESENSERQLTFLIDQDGADMREFMGLLSHKALILKCMGLLTKYAELGHLLTGQVLIVNANHVGTVALNLARPVLGSLAEKIHILPRSQNKFQATLRQLIPEDSIPTWYGGPRNFQPLAVFS